jgi:hypothetical protein
MNTYDESWGMDSKHLFRLPEVAQDIDQVLESTRCRHCEASDWLKDLASNYANEHKVNDFEQEAIDKKQMLSWANQIFSKIQVYVDRFNCTVQSPNYAIESVPLDFHLISGSESSINSNVQEKEVFEGHFASADAALLIRAYPDKIQAFVTAPQVWLRLSVSESSDSEFAPFLTITNHNDKLKLSIAWTGSVQEVEIDEPSIPLLSRLLFCKLIELGICLHQQDRSLSSSCMP